MFTEKTIDREVKRVGQEFVDLTKEFMMSHGLNLDTCGDMFKLDDFVFNVWFDAYEAFKNGDSAKGRKIMNLLIQHKSPEEIEEIVFNMEV
jgi:hypothetical protein